MQPNANILSVADDLRKLNFHHEKLQVEIQDNLVVEDDPRSQIPEGINPYALVYFFVIITKN